MDPRPLSPAFLPPGTRVGAWKVVDLCGRGSFGAVYLVEGVEGFAALKLALAPYDARFAREVGLLSRLSHPCIPRLVEAGEWQHPQGPAHPFLVMEWVEGVPLYVWARARRPTSRQVLRLLAGLARALEATHAAKAVHRDVKGGNVLVRLADDRAFLVDFGSASYAGVTPLTWTVFPPDTPAYRSPEAYRHVQLQGEAEPYAHKPADDVFALGITAYRLVTGEYPPSREPLEVEAYRWQVDGPRPASALNPCCAPVLSALISRMLSLQPEARGGAKLEVAAKDCKPGNYVYKGKCYAPAVPLPPPSTSSPVEKPDGG